MYDKLRDCAIHVYHLIALHIAIISIALPVFGVSLEEAVKRSMLPDGLKLPRVVRECIMKIEEKG